MNKPHMLQSGDTVMIVAPAGPVNKERVMRMKLRLEEMGVHVKLGNNMFRQNGFLAGEDALRLADLQDAITNPNIKAIFCSRGGYGSARLLPYLDLEPLKRQPKIFWGYSDITFLHIICNQFAELVTFHGPMMEECGAEDVAHETFSSLGQLFSPTAISLTASRPDYPPFFHTVRAPIVGGNLTVLLSTLGTPYEIDTRGKILLLEDIGEAPYRIDRMLNQLRLAGKFNECAGILLTDFHDCEAGGNTSLSIEEIVYTHIVPYGIPILNGFSIGHCTPNIGIPLGSYATMDGQSGTLTIEPGVIAN
ncbi:LD-carboxypeptidase [Ectobacillus antri]|jgi:muramoyltetrapeptide carboxypeptidase|uniref:LD-carboxypeptidase n=1 Tax=Ectobacillus antri TaxID=2486280 RepID=A0ABT6H2U3_9BACI|nr:LD-carboxypeptidase [Ectobacillus antri]MDG4658386.1 LD-carboxypeptidase [Ectobacillus antri]MDG5753720.1 LD-carboxypeptidase [Ectobacillus antri]